MILLIKLLLAHFLGDFVFQPNAWVKDKQAKKARSTWLYVHVLLHAVLITLAIGMNQHYWTIVSITVISHYFIDIGKLTLQNKNNSRILFFIDQGLHLAVIIILAEVFDPFMAKIAEAYGGEQAWLLATALVAVTWVSSMFIKKIISMWSPHTEREEDDSLIRAGQFIGYLERLFIFGFVLSNNWEAVGFLLAAKSVFRFGDLRESKDRKLTEYILIGTLLSFGIAILIAILYREAQTLL